MAALLARELPLDVGDARIGLPAADENHHIGAAGAPREPATMTRGGLVHDESRRALHVVQPLGHQRRVGIVDARISRSWPTEVGVEAIRVEVLDAAEYGELRRQSSAEPARLHVG